MVEGLTNRTQVPYQGQQIYKFYENDNNNKLLIIDFIPSDAEELLGMEDEWLTFRAKLSFSTKDNKVSVEIVRFHSTKKDTSDWRMGKENVFHRDK